MRRKTIIVAASVLALIGLLIVLCVTLGRDSALRLSVDFVAYQATPNTPSGRVATFNITNKSRETVLRLGRYDVDSVELGSWTCGRVDSGKLLAPGHSETIAVPVNTNEVAYRVSFEFKPYGARRHWIDAIANSRFKRWLPSQLRRDEKYDVVTSITTVCPPK